MPSRIAVVTGSTSGIGLAIVREFARLGNAVVINSHKDGDAERELARETAREFGVDAHYVSADLTDATAARALVAAARDRFGRVDILVNNAGMQHVAKIEDFPIAKWDAILALNLSAAFHTSAAVTPLMKASGWGRIVNIASAHGLRASPYKSAYVAAKHGLVGLTKAIALEFAEARLAATCNAVCPGYVYTPLVDQQIEDTMKQYGKSREAVIDEVILARQPTREFATVDQVAATVAFLCSDAAAQITGTTLSIDGGWTAA